MEDPAPTFSTIAQPSSKTCKIRTRSPGETSSSSSRVGTNGRQIISTWEKAGGLTGSLNGLTCMGATGVGTHVTGKANSGLKTGGGELSWTRVVDDEAGERTAWRGDSSVGGDVGAGGFGNENVSEGEKGRTDMGDVAPASISFSVETSRYCAPESALFLVMFMKNSLCAAWPPVAIKTELRSRTSAIGGSSGTPNWSVGDSMRKSKPWSKCVAKELRALALLPVPAPVEFWEERLLTPIKEKLREEPLLLLDHHCLRR